MRDEHLKYLVCPECGGALTIQSIECRESEKIREGSLACLLCGRGFPIHGYIPRFVPIENYASGFGLQWNTHKSTQYDSATGLLLSERRFFEATGWPRNMRGKRVMEAGSGSGRFTEQVVKTGAFVVSFDYSSAVEANYLHNGHNDNVLIVQADILSPPVARQSFDNIFCFGVLQHTPDPRSSFFSLQEYLKTGGRLAIDVYKRNRLSKFLSFTPAPPTKYYVRPFTRRVPPERLYAVIQRYIDIMWPLSKLLSKIPGIGRNLNWMLLIADYRNLGVDEEAAKQWAYLDTFDMLAPRYDAPQTLGTVKGWFKEAGLVESEVAYGYNGIVGRGRKA